MVSSSNRQTVSLEGIRCKSSKSVIMKSLVLLFIYLLCPANAQIISHLSSSLSNEEEQSRITSDSSNDGFFFFSHFLQSFWLPPYSSSNEQRRMVSKGAGGGDNTPSLLHDPEVIRCAVYSVTLIAQNQAPVEMYPFAVLLTGVSDISNMEGDGENDDASGVKVKLLDATEAVSLF